MKSGKESGSAAIQSGADTPHSTVAAIQSYNRISSITPTQWLGCSVPAAKCDSSSNTWSEKPPMLRMSSRSEACVVPLSGVEQFVPPLLMLYVQFEYNLGLRPINNLNCQRNCS